MFSAYCSEDLDKALNTALASSERPDRERIFRQIVQRMTDNVSHVFLWQEDALYGMTRDVEWNVRNDDRVYAWEISRKQ